MGINQPHLHSKPRQGRSTCPAGELPSGAAPTAKHREKRSPGNKGWSQLQFKLKIVHTASKNPREKMVKLSGVFLNQRASPASLKKQCWRCLGGVTCQGTLRGAQQEKHTQTSLPRQNSHGMWLCHRPTHSPESSTMEQHRTGTTLPWKSVQAGRGLERPGRGEGAPALAGMVCKALPTQTLLDSMKQLEFCPRFCSLLYL